MIENNLDTLVPVQKNDLDLLGQIDGLIQNAVDHRNPEMALAYGGQLRLALHLSGVALAKFLYTLYNRWAEFDSGDEFYESIYFSRIGYSKQTVQKYIKVWEWVFAKVAHSEQRRMLLLGKPIDGLYRIATLSEEEGLTEGTWDDIAKAATKADILDIRDGIKSVTKARNRLVITINSGGTIMAIRGNEMSPVGALNVQSENELIRAAISRICRSAGLVEVP